MIPGFLLLGSHLGDPDRRLLTPAQLEDLTKRMQLCSREKPDETVSQALLSGMGYGTEAAQRILALLAEKDRMALYLDRGRQMDCHPITRGDPLYPALVRRRLGGESPACFFYKGDPSILNRPSISLVGSRNLRQENREFAREAGRQAALHGVTLVSGNARGADQEAQRGCLEAGGRVISIVADCLSDKQPRENLLYLSQEDFDAPFSAARALSRNRIIHTLGYLTLVAQCRMEQGGTWSGTTRNLSRGWSTVVCFRDGSPASLELERRGAYLMGLEELPDLSNLGTEALRWF